MPNSLGPNGLQIKTQAELITELSTKLRTIYGEDINLDPDTPDGQMMMIFIQATLDNLDLLAQIYNSMSPDFAMGKVLDQRVAYNGIQRQEGTFTITPISVTVDQAITLYGLDQDVEPVFTVSDDEGNEFELVTTVAIGGAGTASYSFRSKVPGAVLTVPNTITNPVTVVLGVTAINNPTTYTTAGINEETDYELRLRRQRSVSLASQGYLASLIAELENISAVNYVAIYENNTGSTDGDGIPSHSIWVIVDGGEDEDIANAIYRKRNAGCGMFGDEAVIITRVDGSPFTIRFDRVQLETLFIFFDAESLNGVDAPDTTAILAELPDLLDVGVFQQVNVNEVATKVQEIDPNTLVLNAFLSNGRSQSLEFSGAPASGTFKIVYNEVESAAINWNDDTITIQGKVQAVTGLDDATVIGTIGSGTVTILLDDVPTVEGLITTTDNSLETADPVAVDIDMDYDLESTITPTSKAKRFSIIAANIDIEVI